MPLIILLVHDDIFDQKRCLVNSIYRYRTLVSEAKKEEVLITFCVVAFFCSNV
jgi:hypothetical protein